MVYNLWLVESEDMEPSDTEDHGTFFFLTVVLEWRGEVIFHSVIQEIGFLSSQ